MKSRKINKSRLALTITAGTLGALAQQAVAAGFIEDSKASLTLRNFYINTDAWTAAAVPARAAWTASRAPCSRWKATVSRCTTSPAWA